MYFSRQEQVIKFIPGPIDFTQMAGHSPEQCLRKCQEDVTLSTEYQVNWFLNTIKRLVITKYRLWQFTNNGATMGKCFRKGRTITLVIHRPDLQCFFRYRKKMVYRF